MSTRPRVLLAALIITSALPMAAEAQGRTSLSSSEARIPVKIVAGRLVARCDLSTQFRRIPVNLFIDYERPCALELHNRAAHPLGVDKPGGSDITVHLHGFNLRIQGREHGDEDALNEFTRLYSRELGEVAAVGTIGSKVLGGYHVRFDLEAGFIYLRPPAPVSDAAPDEGENTVVTSCTLTNDLVWIPVRGADGSITSMCIGTSRYDSVVDEDLCHEAGKPAGDIGAVRLKEHDLHRFCALRPEELIQVHPDGALGVLGLNVLRCFRVEIDRVNKWVKFTQTRAALYPDEDLEFFQARLEDEPEPLVAWLKKHKGKRLARECAELLLAIQLETSGAPTKDFEIALHWMNETRIEDLRSTEALKTMKLLIGAQRPDVAILAGEIGVKGGRKDRYPESVHQLHSKLGELMVEQPKHRRKAWEHLLSAAFGLPEDGMINLYLGRFYELEERWKRAMSRYILAVIQPESGPMAVTALERLQKAMGGPPLSVDVVDKMIAGKVFNFGAPNRFEPTEKNTTNRCVLVEFFTNAHFGRRLREGWRSFAVGGSMACEGLLSHFEREQVAVLMYHVEAPQATALQNDLSLNMAGYYGDPRPVYCMVNGLHKGPGAERWRNAEKLYEANRKLVNDALTQRTDWSLSFEKARVADGVVSGKLIVKGPGDPGLVVQIVCAERGVLYPGKAKVVVHRMVARGALTGSLDGVVYKPTDGEMQITFNKALADLTRENEKFLDNYEAQGGGACSRLSTKIDPRQVTLVAYIRDLQTREVLQAVQVHPMGAEPERKAR